MRSLLAIRVLFIISSNTMGQVKSDHFLHKILSKNKDSLFQDVLRQPGKFRYQVIYTRIDRDRHNRPSFRNYYYNVDPLLYYYPASVVKLPLAFLSLEKINGLKEKGVSANTSILFDAAYDFQEERLTDSTAENHQPSIAHYIKKALLVSDNDAYNRMYQFLGQGPLNRRLHEKGYERSRITRQFRRLTPEQNRQTNPFRFVDATGRTIYESPGMVNKDSFDFSHPFSLGKAYINWQDSLVESPMDFSAHNYIPLEDLQQMLQSVMFPASVSPKQRFSLNGEDYQFLYQYLSQFPGETHFPRYDREVFYDSYVKYFFINDSKTLPEGVRVFNKVGWSYGCLTDVSYVADFRNKVEFMLTATIYVNENQVLNDDTYEYKTIGLPFLYSLGQTIYQYELGRKRKFKPDLSDFRIQYEKRPDDPIPTIREVDN